MEADGEIHAEETAALKRLVAWYRRVKRPMPWRLKVEPYASWLSEIMMQQTTYEQALPYYARFRAAFPTVGALAAADEPAVLKQWEGLGYYARARNLLKAARQIARDGWPATAEGWASVPGVGPYTAAALASVLNGERVPVVDGNVARVFARFWALGDDFKAQPARARLAARLRPRMCGKPGDFNQAMMELGALVCTPKAPACGRCPLAAACRARRDGTQADYPVRAAKKPVPVRRVRAVVVGDGAGRVLLVRNDAGGLLKGLWELPTVEAAFEHAQAFSHFRLEMSVLTAARAASFEDPRAVPLATATRRALEKAGYLSA